MTSTGHTRRDHPSLWQVTTGELVRLRRGFTAWYTLLVPVAIAVPLYLGSLFSPEGRSGHTWTTFDNVTLEFWGTLVPMTAALLAALSVRADQESWRLLLSYAVPRWRYFVGKAAALAVLGFVSSSILALALLGGAALNGTLGHAAGTVLATVYLPWLAGLAVIAIDLVIAVMWGLGPTIAIGVLGMFSGALIADKSFWYLVPFSWPMRVILPLAGIGPNGIALPHGSPLADRGVIPLALVLSVLTLGAALLVGGLHMTRKEV